MINSLHMNKRKLLAAAVAMPLASPREACAASATDARLAALYAQAESVHAECLAASIAADEAFQAWKTALGPTPESIHQNTFFAIKTGEKWYRKSSHDTRVFMWKSFGLGEFNALEFSDVDLRKLMRTDFAFLRFPILLKQNPQYKLYERDPGALYDFCLAERRRYDERTEKLKVEFRVDELEAASEHMWEALDALRDQIARTPAQSIRGLALKNDAFVKFGETDALKEAIFADIERLGMVEQGSFANA